MEPSPRNDQNLRAGLSAVSTTRLTRQWQDEATAFQTRNLAEGDYVYLWVDGIHLKNRLEQEKLCLLASAVPADRLVTDVMGTLAVVVY